MNTKMTPEKKNMMTEDNMTKLTMRNVNTTQTKKKKKKNNTYNDMNNNTDTNDEENDYE